MKKEIIKMLEDAGAGDTYVEDILSESARKFIEENTQIKDEEEIREAIDYYREGFFRG